MTGPTRPERSDASGGLGWRRSAVALIALVCTVSSCTPAGDGTASNGSSPASGVADAEALTSWTDGPTRAAIIDFVARVTDPSSPDFVEPAERIATFDNDGTLWSEQPMYVQLAFALDRVRVLAPEHPEWAGVQPFQGALDGDLQAVAATGMPGLLQLLMATHSGMTTEEFERIAVEWIETARHPTTDRPYTEMVYAPMLELLDYLRDHGFKTFIVSGGGIEFMRPWTEEVYGIPPEQVMGSSVTTRLQTVDGGPVLMRVDSIDFIDDGPGKPVGIHSHIGRRPILAAGNSDGDLEMLQWSAAGDGPSLQILIHHTDADREAAYDSASAFGRLDEALDVARTDGWVVVDMAADWGRVFPFQPTRN